MRGGDLGTRWHRQQDDGQRDHGRLQFPINRDDHATQRCGRRGHSAALASEARLLSKSLGGDDETIGVGVGIDSGKVNFGEFGHAHQDLTAIGTVVNVASRAQSAAAAGEILLISRSRARPVRLETSHSRDYPLKESSSPPGFGPPERRLPDIEKLPGRERRRDSRGSKTSVLTIRADPTLSEAFHEASLAALGHPCCARRLHEFLAAGPRIGDVHAFGRCVISA